MGAPLTMGVIAAPLIFLVVAKLFFGHFCLYSFQSHLKPAICATCFQVSYKVLFPVNGMYWKTWKKNIKSDRVNSRRSVSGTVATVAPLGPKGCHWHLLGLRGGVVALLKNVSGGAGYLRKHTQTCWFVSFCVVVKPYFDVHVFIQSSWIWTLTLSDSRFPIYALVLGSISIPLISYDRWFFDLSNGWPSGTP